MKILIWIINFIKDRWLQPFLGRHSPQVAGSLRVPIKPDQKELLTYMVNQRYSQAFYNPKAVDSYSGNVGVGLRYYVRSAMRKVRLLPGLMPDKKLRDKFLQQDAIKTTSELCMVVSPYIWFLMVGVSVPKFEMYYIQSINRGAITADRKGNFVWLPKRSIYLVRKWMTDAIDVEPVEHNVNFTNVTQMVEGLRSTRIQIGLARKGTREKNTHTFLVGWFGGELLIFDQYHHKFTGKPIETRHPKPDSLWYLYTYK
ncbi:hypothetical protein LCGC14_2848860 [marine sediment metagenome]|uniref:Uncharacterized protein n=1 Tax=marine sediment metagenome TaxID=412755 RepID=A0A0F8YVU0_9ZZZZ